MIVKPTRGGCTSQCPSVCLFVRLSVTNVYLSGKMAWLAQQRNAAWRRSSDGGGSLTRRPFSPYLLTCSIFSLQQTCCKRRGSASCCMRTETCSVTAAFGDLHARAVMLLDPYVKVYLMYNGQRIGKKKTHVKKRTLNPVFNESFIFDLPTTDPTSSGASNFLAGVSLEFVVLDWDQMTKNEVVGRLEIGAGSGDAERAHWLEVVSCPRKQIASWHKLNE